MSRPPSKEDPRQIAVWAARYARSRTIPFLVQWVFIVALVVIIGTLMQITLMAYQSRHSGLLWTAVAVMAATTAILVWFSVARLGGEQIWRISQWLYGKEGYASSGAPDRTQEARRARWLPVVALGLGVYHLILVILVGFRRLPAEYLQPLSAVYMAPFLAIMVVTQGLGFWGWIWPALYTAHAAGVLAGAPHFTGKWFAFDILVPIFGYGLISIIVGHCYSRYALRKLKALTRIPETDDGDGVAGDGVDGGKVDGE